MRRCGPLRISAGSGRPSSSCTSALPRLRLRWACSPICPLRICASSWRERSFNLVCCLWLAWRFFVGSFGFGLASCLASVWGMYHCLYGSGSGIPKLVRRVGSHGPYHPGRIDTERPCLDGSKPGLASQRPYVPWRQCLARAQVLGALGSNALEALPVAFSAQG